jgi:hypothetical protein
MRKVKSKKRAAVPNKPLPPINKVPTLAKSGDKVEDSNKSKSKRTALKAPEVAKSSPVPAGDVRVTANIRKDLHLKLKVRAARRRTTIGELIEGWVSSWGKKQL